MDRRTQRTHYEGLMFHDQVISKWKPAKDVWPFLFGDDALGCLTAMGGLFITHFFRKELKIRPYARITCYAPVVGLPAIGSFIFNAGVITTDVLQVSGCPLCISTKAGISQTVIGLIIPLLVAPTVCFYVADKLLTYPVPPLVKAPGEVFRLYRKLLLKNPRPFIVIGVMHMLAASFITYQKEKTLQKIDFNLNKKRLM